MTSTNRTYQIIKFRSNQWEAIQAKVIAETPVSLTVNGEVWLSFMCTPIDLEPLAVGFLFNEGLIAAREDVVSVRVCPSGDNVDVWTSQYIPKPTHWRRTSGCTGGVTHQDVETIIPDLPETEQVDPQALLSLLERFFTSQELYRQTRGVHSSALCTPDGIQILAEDIGRHNTLDKIAGKLLLNPLPIQPRILLSTGRISSEMIQKAGHIGATIVMSRTSPSTLSIRLAKEWGVTLIGYAHRNEFIVYAHPERIANAPVGLASSVVSPMQSSLVSIQTGAMLDL